jgi:putative oxidoreductase
MKPIGATLLRIILGVIFVTHGYHGYFGLTPEGTAEFITFMGLPVGAMLAWYLIVAHVGGGLMMIAGLWTRWAAAANVPVMVTTIWLYHLPRDLFMTGAVLNATAGKASGPGLEYPLLVLVATIAQVFLGGGALAMTQDR